MPLTGLLGSGNWTKYLWPEELMPLILTDEKNHCELGSGPNDQHSYIEKMARMCLRYIKVASVDKVEQVS